MPYIEQTDRSKYDNVIDEVIAKLKGAPVGHMNYVISRIIWSLWRNNPSYTLGNNLIGVLECVKIEFYRKLLSDYEDIKENENGPVR